MGSIIASAAFALFFEGIVWHGIHILPGIGWRGLFILGAAPALLVFYVRARVPESPVWLEGKRKRLARSVAEDRKQRSGDLARLFNYLPTFLFLVLLMYISRICNCPLQVAGFEQPCYLLRGTRGAAETQDG